MTDRTNLSRRAVRGGLGALPATAGLLGATLLAGAAW